MHGPFKTEALYANGVRMTISGDFPNGIKFYGTKGWIFVSRGNEQVTKSDPVAKLNDATALAVQRSEDHQVGDRSRRNSPLRKQGAARQLAGVRHQPQGSRSRPVEMGHRACSTCLIHDMAMVLKRKLYWDPAVERFKNDEEANSMLSRPQRAPYMLA